MDFDKIVELFRALNVRGVRYVLVGGIAVNLHGLGRTTQDIDLFVVPDEDNVSRLRAALHDVFDDPSIDEISADDLAGSYPTVRYVPPSSLSWWI